jgi:hypothetical protein
MQGPWLALVVAAIALLALAIWSSLGAGAGRKAAAAIVEAQRHISAIQEAHVPIDYDALRTIEADLLAAQTAFNKSRFEEAIVIALRASQAAQDLLRQSRSSQPQQEALQSDTSVP